MTRCLCSGRVRWMSRTCPKGCPCGRHQRKISEEHRTNIVKANQARKGESRPCPKGCTCKKHKAYYHGGSKKGRVLSSEARERIAEGAKNRNYTDESLQHLAEIMRSNHDDPDWEANRIVALQASLTGTQCPLGCTCGKHFTPPVLPQHKDADGREGYIYLIEFSTGIVKVGRTTNPRRRIRAQLYVASKLGVEPKNTWLSILHGEYVANEVALLKQLGSPLRGDEYFRADFSAVVKLAEAIVQAHKE